MSVGKTIPSSTQHNGSPLFTRSTFQEENKTPTSAVPLISQRRTTRPRKLMADLSKLPTIEKQTKVRRAPSKPRQNIARDDDDIIDEDRPHNYPDLLVSSEDDEGKYDHIFQCSSPETTDDEHCDDQISCSQDSPSIEYNDEGDIHTGALIAMLSFGMGNEFAVKEGQRIQYSRFAVSRVK
ncbi:unnamed protein product [Microthlaspi erraticum]|uniref:Uncharacterized protein n=1 Tax=Microthlaspi erraticum TaxID=1685480 RepID=A0A6D2JH52_9BRAS|nr:unnamed protein product [Microthlaspi erraticum]